MKVLVHPRVHKRYPEIEDEDVIIAFRATIRFIRRANGQGVAVGLDGRGRLLEMVFAISESDDEFLVFHAFTPPTSGVLRELGLSR